MRIWLRGSTCAAVVMASTVAWGQGSRTSRLQEVAQRLAQLEATMRRDDLDAVDRHLERLEIIVRDYGQGPRGRDGPPVRLTCLSNGQPGAYERFSVSDSSSGAAMGKPTVLDTCKQLAGTQNAALICVSNGEAGAYERFIPFDLGSRQAKGGGTDLKTCLSVVQRSTVGFTCVSNGQAGSYEKFRLFNRTQDKPLGGETQLAQCLTAIPN